MRMRADRFQALERFHNFLSSDSSPQGHVDFLMSIEDCVGHHRIAPCLSTSTDEVAAWSLSGAFKSSTLPVAVLGAGNTSLPAKWEAILRSICSDCGGKAVQVKQYVGSILGYCSDLGTEFYVDQAWFFQ